jgi:O-glycosyl hydrolase
LELKCFLSKFVRPNSTVIGLSIDFESHSALEGAAFLTPSNQKVLVISNQLLNNVFELAIQDSQKPGKVLNVELPPQTIATVIWT